MSLLEGTHCTHWETTDSERGSDLSRSHSRSVSEQGEKTGLRVLSYATLPLRLRLSLLGTQAFFFIRRGCWTAGTLVRHFHPNSMRHASLWSLPAILQFFRTGPPTSFSVAWRLARQCCPRYPAPGNRSSFPESEGAMDHFLPSGLVGCTLALVGSSQL